MNGPSPSRLAASLFVLPLLLAGLLAPAGASGQVRGGDLYHDVREGTSIDARELGEALAGGLEAVFTDMRPLSVRLRAALMTTDGRRLARWESREVRVESGTTVTGEEWIPRPDQFSEALAPGFGDRRKITFGSSTSTRGYGIVIPRRDERCREATHILHFALAAADEGPNEEDLGLAICLRVE